MMKPSADGIWQSSDDAEHSGCVSESTQTDLEDKFIRTSADLIMGVLDVSWRDRNIVVRCLKSAIESNMKGYLEAYLNGNLEILAGIMNKKLGINEKVDYKNAVHAKFNSIIKKIQKLSGVATESGE